MFRILLAFALLGTALIAHAQTDERPIVASLNAQFSQQFAELSKLDRPLMKARATSPDCEEGCITPSEALQMAFQAGEGQSRTGRFLLDIKGGGQSISGTLDQLFFVSSRQDYARFGTLTIAFEERALYNLLRRAKVCNPDSFRPDEIEVKGCRGDANFDLNMFTMIQRLGGRRVVVDGEVRLQWIDARTGMPRPVANLRGEHEPGYYQVWIKVDDADQVIFFYED